MGLLDWIGYFVVDTCSLENNSLFLIGLVLDDNNRGINSKARFASIFYRLWQDTTWLNLCDDRLSFHETQVFSLMWASDLVYREELSSVDAPLLLIHVVLVQKSFLPELFNEDGYKGDLQVCN